METTRSIRSSSLSRHDNKRRSCRCRSGTKYQQMSTGAQGLEVKQAFLGRVLVEMSPRGLGTLAQRCPGHPGAPGAAFPCNPRNLSLEGHRRQMPWPCLAIQTDAAQPCSRHQTACPTEPPPSLNPPQITRTLGGSAERGC